MSQRKRGSLNLKESLERKKRPANGLSSDKVTKQVKPNQQQSEKKQQWVSSSFGNFDISTSQSVAKNKNPNPQHLHLKNKSSKTDKPRIQIDNNNLWCEKYSPSSECFNIHSIKADVTRDDFQRRFTMQMKLREIRLVKQPVAADLAVHKKKVAEVRDWLLSHISLQKGNGVLLLTGPPGSGKTATLRVLAKEIGLGIQEWVNPLAQDKGDFDDPEWRNYEGMVHRQSQLKNFRDFFLRANKYPSLFLGVSNAEQNKKIILVEDVPNVFYRKASELHDVIGSYQKCSRNPVVFIVSDSNSNDTNAYRLFPKDSIHELGISQISFNPASTTSLNKLVKDIISSEARKKSASFQNPSKETVENLVAGCNGDIRGLINNLQFSCLKGSSLTTFQKLKNKKQSHVGREKSGKRSSKKSAETESTTSSSIGGKDTSLFLFRVLGKVLYCKREETSNAMENSLPEHLKQHERLPLIENPESVFERSHMSGENLNLYLHQNYLDFFNNIDDVCVASDYLSDADHLTGEWMHRSTLCSYMPSVAIRGLMFCNQGQTVNQTKRAWRPLHKPKWWDIFKQTRYNNSTATDLFKGHTRNTEHLHCEYIPYLALSDVPLHSEGQINYLQTVRKFSRNSSSFRDNSGTLQDKEIDDNESELNSSQTQSSQVRLVDDKEILHLNQTGVDDDIQEFDSD